MKKWIYFCIHIIFAIAIIIQIPNFITSDTDITENKVDITSDIKNTQLEKKIESVDDTLETSEIIQMIGCKDILRNKKSPFSVAILDSGTFPHQSLKYPKQKIISFVDLVNGISLPYDDNGHGTAIAGLIAANSQEYKGISPFVDIVSVKVLDYTGHGYKSTLLEGIQWVIDNRVKYNIKIMNISIGIPTEGYDEISDKIEEAYDAGIFVITSSGNDDNAAKMYSPAISKSAIAVGSIEEQERKKDFDYHIADFSINWKTPNGKSKPDILAPGNNISTIHSNIYYKGKGELNNDNLYKVNSGTSLSAAIVTGFVANLIYSSPELSVNEIKSILYENCVEIVTDNKKQYFIYYKGD
ncbi:S8 family serine peptidase [uncultured Clostridium sp.]|uniref:S8 family serine peptidase n=1 Tax=uncultured Clostridium sp. TaxID=59620 RepID=UPI00258ADA01|nr:S8 family serine peptidase [uncultured Clostridium sp.]